MAEMARNIVGGPLVSDEVCLDKTSVIAEKKCRNRHENVRVLEK